MIVQCITNLVADIPDEYRKYHGKEGQVVPALAVDETYTVIGIDFTKGKLLYTINSNSPQVYAMYPGIFKIIDDVIPDDWIMHKYSDESYRLSFKEWTEGDFLDKYYDGGYEEAQLVKAKIQKYNDTPIGKKLQQEKFDKDMQSAKERGWELPEKPKDLED